MPRSWLSRLAERLGFGGNDSEAEDREDYAIAGYVSVWYQGDEAHIVEIAVAGDAARQRYRRVAAHRGRSGPPWSTGPM